MPHDRDGQPIGPGDRVVIHGVVEDIDAQEDYCNVRVRLVEPMPLYVEANTVLAGINARQLVKVTPAEVGSSG